MSLLPVVCPVIKQLCDRFRHLAKVISSTEPTERKDIEGQKAKVGPVSS